MAGINASDPAFRPPVFGLALLQASCPIIKRAVLSRTPHRAPTASSRSVGRCSKCARDRRPRQCDVRMITRWRSGVERFDQRRESGYSQAVLRDLNRSSPALERKARARRFFVFVHGT